MSLLVWLLGCFFALLLACWWTSLLLLQSLWCLLVWWLAGWLAFMSECVCGWFVVANDRWQKGGQEQDHDQEHEQEQEHEQKQKQEQEQEQNQKQEPDFGTHLYGNMSKLIFFVFFVDAKDFSQTLVILSSMFNLPIFKYATAHWFCLDPALWASFFRTDLCVSFHKFSLFLISPQKMRPPIAFWWPNFWFLQNMQQLINFAWIPRSGRIFWNRSLWGLSQILTFLIFAENFATPPITLMT